MGLALGTHLFTEVLDLALEGSDQGIRAVGWSVGGRARLVGGCTVGDPGVEEDVNRPTFAFYGECAPAYAAAHGLGADT